MLYCSCKSGDAHEQNLYCSRTSRYTESDICRAWRSQCGFVRLLRQRQATERSDVDLLVDSGLRGLAFFGLLEDVVSALDVSVDMIDVSQVEQDSPVELEIERSGVQIYIGL